MRPRVFPAEDHASSVQAFSVRPSFNEAAGIPRGRRRSGGVPIEGREASMRPRVFPAEDAIQEPRGRHAQWLQ